MKRILSTFLVVSLLFAFADADRQSDVFSAGYGEAIPVAISEQTAFSTASDTFAAALPASYDPRILGLTTPVKTQGGTATCWAFAVVGAAEMLAKKETGRDITYSEEHLRFFVSNQNPDYGYMRGPDDAASFWHGASYFLNQNGAISEKDIPFNGYEGASPPSNLYTAALRSVFGGTKTIFPSGGVEAIKMAIAESGGVYMQIWCGDSRTETSITDYYDKTNYSINYTLDNNANHAVTAVGWDDNFPRTKFKKQPAKDGAWLVKNSWGTGFGDGGYFWVSYEDKTVTGNQHYAFTDFQLVDNDKKVVSYDTVYPDAWIGYEDEVFAANVFSFDAATSSDYYIDEIISFQKEKQFYEIYILPKSQLGNASYYVAGNAVASGYAEHRGYYTHKLNNPYTFSAGEYAVVLRCLTSDGDAFVYHEWGDGGKYVPDISPGQSYYSKSGVTWNDLYDSLQTWGDTDLGNFHIKAVLSKKTPTTQTSTLSKSDDTYKNNDVTVSMNLGVNFLEKVEADGSLIYEKSDYSINGLNITFLKSFFEKLPMSDSVTFTLHFTKGQPQTFTVDTRVYLQSVSISPAYLNMPMQANVLFSRDIEFPHISYQWQVSADRVNFSDIPSATSATYVPTLDDVGKYIRVQVISSNTNIQGGTVTSGISNAVSDSRPALESVLLSGDAIVGLDLTAEVTYSSEVIWPDVLFRWQKSQDGIDYTDIEGVTGNRYTIQEADAEMYIRVRVVSQGVNVETGEVVSPFKRVAALGVSQKEEPSKPQLPTVIFREGLKLKDIYMPAGWYWLDPEIAITSVGQKSYPAKYLEDENFKSITINIDFEVKYADTGSVIDEGDTLPEDDDKLLTVLLIAAIGLFVVCAVLLVVLLSKKGKNKKPAKTAYPAVYSVPANSTTTTNQPSQYSRPKSNITPPAGCVVRIVNGVYYYYHAPTNTYYPY